MGKWEEAVECFEWVREIPFRLPTSVDGPDYTCEGKHQILYYSLHGLGIEVRPRICESRWNDLKQMPPEILGIPHDNDIWHIYLQFRRDGKWKNLDATVDSGLTSVLPVSEWAGRGATDICVKPGKIFSAKRSMREFRTDNDWSDDLKRNYDFYVAMNKWFDSLRQE